MVRDGIVFKDEDGQVIFNQHSFCELVKHLLVELVGISYEEASQIVDQVFICGLDWKIGRNLNAFNDILRGGFGRHEYGQPIHIQWLAYEKSVRNLGKETMDTIVEIILDTDHSGHDCSLERL